MEKERTFEGHKNNLGIFDGFKICGSRGFLTDWSDERLFLKLSGSFYIFSKLTSNLKNFFGSFFYY